MEIDIRKNGQGTSTRLTVVILRKGTNNIDNIMSNKINIDQLAKVQFCIKQKAGYKEYIESMIMVQKYSYTTPSIKVKVFFEEKLCSDRNYGSYSENASCIHLGEKKSIFRNFTTEIQIFSFNVTISINVVESTTYEKLFKDAEFTDFRLSTPEGSVAVHKSVLAANSDVFKTMLSQEWKETAEGKMQTEGVTLQTLQHLKQYMYLGTLPNKSDDGLLPLLSIASCYLMETLKTECILKLTQIMKPQDLYNILEYSIVNELPELAFAIMRVPEPIVAEAEKFIIKKDHQVPKEK